MKCPVCNHDLIDGKISSAYPMVFRAENQCFFHNSKETNHIKVNSGSFLTGILEGCSAKAHYCSICKVFTIPID